MSHTSHATWHCNKAHLHCAELQHEGVDGSNLPAISNARLGPHCVIHTPNKTRPTYNNTPVCCLPPLLCGVVPWPRNNRCAHCTETMQPFKHTRVGSRSVVRASSCAHNVTDKNTHFLELPDIWLTAKDGIKSKDLQQTQETTRC